MVTAEVIGQQQLRQGKDHAAAYSSRAIGDIFDVDGDHKEPYHKVLGPSFSNVLQDVPLYIPCKILSLTFPMLTSGFLVRQIHSFQSSKRASR